MNKQTGNKLTQGLLAALDRDRAKQVFAAKQPDALQQFLEDLTGDQALGESGAVVTLSRQATFLQQTLLSDSIASEATRPLLELALLGGRALADDADLKVRLVRPDVVPKIAHALASIDADRFKDSWANGETVDQAAALLAVVQQLYQQAEERRCAVLFAESGN